MAKEIVCWSCYLRVIKAQTAPYLRGSIATTVQNLHLSYKNVMVRIAVCKKVNGGLHTYLSRVFTNVDPYHAWLAVQSQSILHTASTSTTYACMHVYMYLQLYIVQLKLAIYMYTDDDEQDRLIGASMSNHKPRIDKLQCIYV